MTRALRRVWQAVALNGFWVPLNFQDTALPAITIPAAIVVLAPAEHVRALAAVLAAMSLLAMIVPPIAGAISDRLRRAGVPRRAVIWIGVAIDMAALVMLANIHALAAFVVFVLMATLGANVSLAAYQAMIPDVVPKEQWGIASGIRNVATLVGVILGFSVSAGTTIPTTFIGVAVAAGAGALLLFGQPELAVPNHTEERARIGDWHDFIVVFAARLFLAFGLALLMTFVLYFFRDVLHVGNPSAGTAFVGFASLAGAIASGMYLGWLSDRVPRKYIVAACGIPMAAAAAGFATFPVERAMYGFAVLFGIGFGGIMSTGWALAMDAVPKLRDVARDLGIWGIAQNLPQVIAPLAGGAVLSAYGNSEAGYRVLFYSAAGCFALGSATVLAVGRRPIVPWWGRVMRIVAAIVVRTYVRTQNRVRSWGRLPRRRPSTLIVANHQVELDLMEPFASFILQSTPRTPVVSVSARLMYEPGFMAMRVPALWRLLHGVNFAWLFAALGMFPLENELQSRSVARWAYALERKHGVLSLDAIFKPAFLQAHDLSNLTTRDLFRPGNFARAQRTHARLSDLQTVYRKEVFDEMRAFVEEDLQRFEWALKKGATVFVTPEGEYPSDGKMLPFRGIWDRLAPKADDVYLCAISYDPFRTQKFSQLYRVVRLRDRARAVDELRAARPVTVSALLARWLTSLDGDFTSQDAQNAVASALRNLPENAFVDPELQADTTRCVRDALRALERLGIIEASGRSYVRGHGARHPRFERTPDVVEHQANFLEETLSACLVLGPINQGR